MRYNALDKICITCKHFTTDDWTGKLHCDQEEEVYENSSHYARQLLFPQCIYDAGLYRMQDYDLFPCGNLYMPKEIGFKWWIKFLLLFCKKRYRIEKKELWPSNLNSDFQITYKILFKKEYILAEFPLPPEHINCRCVT